MPHDILSREEIVCEKPLLTVDRQMGLNIVHPDGKVPYENLSLITPDQTTYCIFWKTAKTIFNLIRYDENTDSSVVRCEFFPSILFKYRLLTILQVNR